MCYPRCSLRHPAWCNNQSLQALVVFTRQQRHWVTNREVVQRILHRVRGCLLLSICARERVLNERALYCRCETYLVRCLADVWGYRFATDVLVAACVIPSAVEEIETELAVISDMRNDGQTPVRHWLLEDGSYSVLMSKGVPFFYNLSTGASQWKPPRGFEHRPMDIEDDVATLTDGDVTTVPGLMSLRDGGGVLSGLPSEGNHSMGSPQLLELSEGENHPDGVSRPSRRSAVDTRRKESRRTATSRKSDDWRNEL